MACLLKIFLLVLGVWFGIMLAQYLGFIGNDFFLLSFAEVIHVLLFFASMALWYTLAYSTIEVDSPSLRITLTICNAGPDGLAKEDLGRSFSMGDKFLAARIDSLVRDGMFIVRDGRYTASLKGRLAMYIVVYYRRVLGTPTELG
jgi:hypothetical protein